MDNAFLVRRAESGDDLLCVLDCPALRNRAVVQMFAQLLAFEQFRNDVWSAVVNVDVMDDKNVWMI